MLTTCLALLASLALLYLGLGLLLYFKQERLVFHPSREILCDPSDAGLPFEEVSFKASDGVALKGWFIPAPDSAAPSSRTILFCCGNAGNVSYFLETAGLFRSLGCSTLLFNYRGYGTSQEVPPSEPGLYLDAEAAWDYLVETRKIPAGRVVPVGRSLGGGVACELALRKRPSALVLESTFASIPAMASALYPVFPGKLLSRIAFDNLAKAPSLDCPVLLFHSFEDEIVPYRQGKELFKALGSSRKSMTPLTGGHNDCYFVSRESYVAALSKFFAELP